MDNLPTRHVLPGPKGIEWGIKTPGSNRFSLFFATQLDAVIRARIILKNRGGGTLIIHGRDGRITGTEIVV